MLVMSHAENMWKGEQEFKICVTENQVLLYENDSHLNVIKTFFKTVFITVPPARPHCKAT